MGKKKKGKKKKRRKASSTAIPTTNREWAIKNAADTIMQAEVIQADKKLMPSVNVELRKRKRAINKVLS